MAGLIALAIIIALCRIPKSKASPIPEPNALVERSFDSVAQCINYQVPLTVTSENFVFNISKFQNDFDVVDLVTDYARKDANVTFNPIGGKENVTADYFISGTFCSPKNPSGHEKTVLLATHGVGYDRRYWDSSYKPSEYSFVEAMVEKGYSIFFYDRLGTGESQKVSGYVNQPSIQIEIIANLAKLLRNGSYTGTIGKPKSVVLVGHSFGSFTSNNILAKYPTLVDGAVLTGLGYSTPDYNSKLLLEGISPRIASQQSPSRFSALDTGYLTFADIYSHINTFFKAPAYEIDAAKYAQSIAQPFAITEYLSLALINPLSPAFQGPVLVTTGEFDFAVCGGECYSSFAQQPLKAIFPKSRQLESFVQPGAGHGINFATNATGFYNGIADFLQRGGF